MNAMRRLLETSPLFGPLVLRVFLGVVMFPHGAQKMLGWFGGHGFSATMQAFTQGMHIPAPFAFLALFTEFFGSIALILGLLTRLSAFGIAIVMMVAIFTVHLPNGFFMNWTGTQKGEGFEYHLLMLGMATALMVMGGGICSADRALVGKTKSRG
ncbi:MAG: DoxX family protein [Verrucomicrobiales bacterium]|nr:DoxX family protein [Verrucomicrobiales bacterium]